MFDLASVTKVVATTTASMFLYDKGYFALGKQCWMQGMSSGGDGVVGMSSGGDGVVGGSGDGCDGDGCDGDVVGG